MPCLSCNNCFLKGNCVQDNNDSMGLIKEKILEADLIILGSPVFAHNVSGDMKTFIDRISYWLHVFRLANKKSITITTSASNGNINVNNYLSKILTMLGSQNILDIKITTMIPNLLNDTEFMKDELINYVDLICNELNDFACISTEIQ
jgi:multimeric flavodoxin WrbA